jgi:hypothetical protein
VTFRGSAVDALNAMLSAPAQHDGTPEPYRAPAIGPVVIERVEASAVEREAIHTGEPARITLRYRADEPVDVLWGFGIWSADQWILVATEYDMRPRRLERGSGTLTCVLPRLSLTAARYTLRAALIDARTRMALAHFGYSDEPAVLVVASTPSVLGNAQRAENALVTMDVDWG